MKIHFKKSQEIRDCEKHKGATLYVGFELESFGISVLVCVECLDKFFRNTLDWVIKP